MRRSASRPTGLYGTWTASMRPVRMTSSRFVERASRVVRRAQETNPPGCTFLRAIQDARASRRDYAPAPTRRARRRTQAGPLTDFSRQPPNSSRSSWRPAHPHVDRRALCLARPRPAPYIGEESKNRVPPSHTVSTTSRAPRSSPGPTSKVCHVPSPTTGTSHPVRPNRRRSIPAELTPPLLFTRRREAPVPALTGMSAMLANALPWRRREQAAAPLSPPPRSSVEPHRSGPGAPRAIPRVLTERALGRI